MARDISVSIAVDGEKEFSRALKEAQSAVKVLDSELKASEAAYRNSGDAQQYLTNKQKLLNDQLEQQRIVADKLAAAVNDAAQEFGDAARETDRYRIAYNNARESMEKMEKELKDADREMEELGRDSIRVGRQLDQGLGDGAREAAQELDDMSELLDSVKQLTKLEGISVGIDVVSKAVDVMDGVKGIIEGSEEFNRTLSYLNQNAKEAGISEETLGENISFATAALGNFDQAAEGLNNLMGAKLNAKELADAMNLLIGAAIDIPETFTFPALAEGLRETLQQKEAVGQFADLLSYLNVDLETFNEAMSKTSNAESAQDVLLSMISNRGLEETLHGWAQDNEDMIAAATAAFDLNKNLGELAKTMTPLGTAWDSMLTSIVSLTDTVFDNTQIDEWISGVIGKVEEGARTIEALTDPEKRKIIKDYEETKESIKRAQGLAQEFEERGETDSAQAIRSEAESLKAELLELKNSAEEMGLGFLIKPDEETETEAETSGKSLGDKIVDGMTTALVEGTKKAETGAETLMNGLKTIFGEPIIPDWTSALWNQITGINELANRTATKLPVGWNVGGGIAPEATNPMLSVNVNVGNRTVAREILPMADEYLGRQIDLNV